jgi:hypothetical protein
MTSNPSRPRRIQPDPIPQIHPVWEFEAEGPLIDAYAAYKGAFQVPWVGVVSLAYAHYRNFFELWFKAMEPLVQSRDYVTAAWDLRRMVETKVAELEPRPITDNLRALGYSDRELDQIRDAIEFFSHGNFIQIPAVAAARFLLEGGAMAGGDDVTPFDGRHAPQSDTPFVLMERHHAADQTAQTYDDVMARLGLPFVNTDYRALARWPSYFDLAWRNLTPVLAKPGYEELAQAMHDAIFGAVAALPNPAGLTAADLQTAARQDGNMQKLIDTTRLFTYLLPGLVINVACFRAQLAA